MMLLTLFVILTLGFFVIRLMPGSPFDDPELSPAMRQMLEEKYGLDQPIHRQYFRYMGRLLQGDWGVSLKIEPMRPVFQVIGERIGVTLVLNMLSLLLAFPLGMLAGSRAALNTFRRGQDRLTDGMVILSLSIPSFVMASLLQSLLGYRSGLFAIAYRPLGSPGEQLYSLILPVLALSFYPMATLCRYLRGELLENLSSDYMLLARCKGLTEKQALHRHALGNAMVPLMPVIVPMFTNVLAGSLVVEKIFNIPGVGGLLTRSIQAGDHSLTVAVLIFYALIHLLTVLITDLSYGLMDPRIRLGGGHREH